MLVLCKAGKTQFVEGDRWRKLADTLTLTDLVVEAERGNIYSDDGRMLATTIPSFEVRMDLKSDALTTEIFEKNIDSLSLLLAKHVGEQDKNQWKLELIKARKRGDRYFLVAKGLSYPQLKIVKTWPLFRLGKYKSGLLIVQHNNRRMPFGMLAQRTIGYIRDSSRVRVGIEGKFDKELSGEKGILRVQKIAGSTYMPLDDVNDLGSKPGLDIYTTIDINLQDVAEGSLMRSLITYQADHGCAVLMNVKTGEIKAMANLGKDKNGNYTEIFNYAIGEPNEPGSVFKLASIISLVEDGYCDENTQVDLENGRKKYYNRTMEDAHPESGIVSLKQVFEKSSNVGISKLIQKFYGEDKTKFYENLQKLHLTRATGIDLSGEPNPLIREPKKWSGTSLPWISIGYEVQHTPLQILNLYAAVANGGKMMKPYLVKEVRENNIIKQQMTPTVMEEKICSETTIQKVRMMLEGVVETGTASSIRNEEYKIAGKTGTNLISNRYTKYSDKIYQATFVGYFPANDPLYACIVVVNNPDTKLGYYGGVVSAPVFRDIADKLYASEIKIHKPINKDSVHKNILVAKGNQQELEKIYNKIGVQNTLQQSGTEWSGAVNKGNKVELQTATFSKKTIPNVVDMSAKDAVYLLESMGAKVQLIGKGKIKQQSVPSGTAVYKGIKITLSLG